jgi:hypothetical protein
LRWHQGYTLFQVFFKISSLEANYFATIQTNRILNSILGIMLLRHFNISYFINEDRLLLQAIGDGEPQSFWITRRAALMIAEGIQKVLSEQYKKYGGSKVSTDHVNDLLAFDHTVAAQKNPPKAGAIQSELTTAPILVYQIGYSANNLEQCVINLTDAQGNGHGYRLTAEMLHALLNLIQSQCDLAGWGIRLIRPTVPSSANAASLH